MLLIAFWKQHRVSYDRAQSQQHYRHQALSGLEQAVSRVINEMDLYGHMKQLTGADAGATATLANAGQITMTNPQEEQTENGKRCACMRTPITCSPT
jgi:hypothetical protein